MARVMMVRGARQVMVVRGVQPGVIGRMRVAGHVSVVGHAPVMMRRGRMASMLRRRVAMMVMMRGGRDVG